VPTSVVVTLVHVFRPRDVTKPLLIKPVQQILQLMFRKSSSKSSSSIRRCALASGIRNVSRATAVLTRAYQKPGVPITPSSVCSCICARCCLRNIQNMNSHGQINGSTNANTIYIIWRRCSNHLDQFAVPRAKHAQRARISRNFKQVLRIQAHRGTYTAVVKALARKSSQSHT
jgi:hypothetical protein